MFDIGFSELFIIALVGLLVLGPKRLPEVARTAGHWLGKFRRFISDVKQDIDREMQQVDMAELRSLKQELDDTRRAMEETSGRLLQEANIAPTVEADGLPETSPSDLPPLAEPKAESASKKRAPKRRKKAAVPKQEHGQTQ